MQLLLSKFLCSHYVFLGSPCIIQDNLFYLTLNNKFIISREIGKQGKGEVCITSDNLNLKCNVLSIENVLKNDRLFHLQGSIFCLVFGFRSYWYVAHNK